MCTKRIRLKLTAHLRLISLKISNCSQRKDNTGTQGSDRAASSAFTILSEAKSLSHGEGVMESEDRSPRCQHHSKNLFRQELSMDVESGRKHLMRNTVFI